MPKNLWLRLRATDSKLPNLPASSISQYMIDSYPERPREPMTQDKPKPKTGKISQAIA